MWNTSRMYLVRIILQQLWFHLRSWWLLHFGPCLLCLFLIHHKPIIKSEIHKSMIILWQIYGSWYCHGSMIHDVAMVLLPIYDNTIELTMINAKSMVPWWVPMAFSGGFLREKIHGSSAAAAAGWLGRPRWLRTRLPCRPLGELSRAAGDPGGSRRDQNGWDMLRPRKLR